MNKELVIQDDLATTVSVSSGNCGLTVPIPQEPSQSEREVVGKAEPSLIMDSLTIKSPQPPSQAGPDDCQASIRTKNTMVGSELTVVELAVPQRRTKARKTPPLVEIHGRPFFETVATLDSASSSKWSVSIYAHLRHRGVFVHPVRRGVKIGFVYQGTLVVFNGHIRPRKAVAFLDISQMEAHGLKRGVPFLATLVSIDDPVAIAHKAQPDSSGDCLDV